jgi:ABC-type polysaccharide/polyol phosphate transport system ATPase subunit
MAKLVVMVSHDLAAIAKYCSRVVWVDHGQVRLDGDPSTVITSYMESAQRPNNAAA